MISLLEDIGELIFGSKRQDAFKHFASQKDFYYHRRIRMDSFPSQILISQLFQSSKKREVKGFIAKTHDSIQTRGHIFDLSHRSEMGEKITTVFLFQCPKFKLPQFKVFPKSTLSKFGSIFSSGEWSHIDAQFDKAYEVTADDLNRMRILLTIQFAEEVMKLQSFTVEGQGDYFMIYQKHQKIDIIDMDNIYDIGLHLSDIILH